MARERTSIPIQGINRSESDATVRDGSCEDLYNLRYRSGVFESVCRPRIIQPVNDWQGYEVVMRLDDMPANEYVARKGDWLHHIQISSGEVLLLSTIDSLPESTVSLHYFRYGRMMYVNWQSDDGYREKVYYYQSGHFTLVDIAGLQPPSLQISCSYKSVNTEEVDIGGTKFDAVKLALIVRDEDKPTDNVETWYYNVEVGALQELGYIFGTFYLFAAYRLYDGSFIKPTPLYVVSSDHWDACGNTPLPLLKVPEELEYHTVGGNDNNYWAPKDNRRYEYYGYRHGVKPTVTVTLPEVASALVEQELIVGISLFATRDMETFRYDELPTSFGDESHPATLIHKQVRECWACSHGCIRNPELDEALGGPFYRIADLDVKGEMEPLELTYEDHFQHIENEDIWEADYSSHDTVSVLKYEYNNRLHIADLRTRLVENACPFVSASDVGDNMIGFGRTRYQYDEESIGQYELGVDWTLTVNGEREIVQGHFSVGLWRSGNRTALVLRNPLCYPDYRCWQADLWIRDKKSSRVVFHRQFDMEQLPSSNLGVHIFPSAGDVTVEGFPAMAEAPKAMEDNSISSLCVLSVNLAQPITYQIPEGDHVNRVLVERNKIRVSNSGNPFEYSPANIYTIGSQGETIREVISTAERMTEAAYGYQPLLVFTDRAVYALESGEGEVLYARNIPILSRAIYEGTNAVEGNGSVFFSCSSGVISIVRGEITNISEVMRRAAGSLPPSGANEPVFESYLQGARLLFNRKESELIVYHPDYTYAYLYSLSGNYWSRRQWESAIEPYFDEVVLPEGIASLSEEDSSRPEKDCSLITRPMKFGSIEYTRLESVAARMRWGDKRRFVLLAEGSDDCARWVVLHSEADLPYLRRMPSSFRYHRIRLVGSVGDYLAVTHFDVEYYTKFVHRLR